MSQIVIPNGPSTNARPRMQVSAGISQRGQVQISLILFGCQTTMATMTVEEAEQFARAFLEAWERRSELFHCNGYIPYTDVDRLVICHPIDGLTEQYP